MRSEDLTDPAWFLIGVVIGVLLIVVTAYFFGCHAAIGDLCRAPAYPMSTAINGTHALMVAN